MSLRSSTVDWYSFSRGLIRFRLESPEGSEGWLVVGVLDRPEVAEEALGVFARAPAPFAGFSFAGVFLAAAFGADKLRDRSVFLVVDLLGALDLGTGAGVRPRVVDSMSRVGACFLTVLVAGGFTVPLAFLPFPGVFLSAFLARDLVLAAVFRVFVVAFAFFPFVPFGGGGKEVDEEELLELDESDELDVGRALRLHRDLELFRRSSRGMAGMW